METVEVVIKIPKIKLDRINKIANGIWGTSNLDAQEIAILNGTVLQKGHGNLIDSNVVKQKVYDIVDLYDSGEYLVFEDCKYLIGNDIQNDNRRILSLNEALQGVINGIPIIIETDIESENNDELSNTVKDI